MAESRIFWQDCYRAAVLETDRVVLPHRIRVVHAALSVRLFELEKDQGGTPEERAAISDAITGIGVLMKVRSCGAMLALGSLALVH